MKSFQSILLVLVVLASASCFKSKSDWPTHTGHLETQSALATPFTKQPVALLKLKLDVRRSGPMRSKSSGSSTEDIYLWPKDAQFKTNGKSYSLKKSAFPRFYDLTHGDRFVIQKDNVNPKMFGLNPTLDCYLERYLYKRQCDANHIIPAISGLIIRVEYADPGQKIRLKGKIKDKALQI